MLHPLGCMATMGKGMRSLLTKTTQVCAHTLDSAHTCMHKCTHTHTHTCTNAHIHTHTHTHMHKCIHTHTHTHTHAQMHTYTHTHTHTQITNGGSPQGPLGTCIQSFHKKFRSYTTLPLHSALSTIHDPSCETERHIIVCPLPLHACADLVGTTILLHPHKSDQFVYCAYKLYHSTKL